MMLENLTETVETGAAILRSEIRDIELPDDQATRQAADAVRPLKSFLREHPDSVAHIQIAGEDPNEDPTTITVPAAAVRVLAEVLDELSDGNAVAVAPVQAELTSQQAADLLNVSRPYLIKLLDGDQIPYRRVGNRRKILLSHLLAYRRRDEAHRRHVADRLTQEAERIGLAY